MDKENKTKKRAIVAIVAIVCASITAIILKFEPSVYATIIIAAISIFTANQTATDLKKKEDK